MNAEINAKEIFDTCRTQIDMASSIAFDNRTESEILALTKICSMIVIDEMIDWSEKFQRTGDWKVGYLKEVKQELQKL